MHSQIHEPDVALSPINLRYYLEDRGWTKEGYCENEKHIIYSKNQEDIISIPIDSTDSEYPEMTELVISTLIEVENRSLTELIYDISTINADTIRIRSTDPTSIKSSLSLEQEANLLNNAYNMMDAVTYITADMTYDLDSPLSLDNPLNTVYIDHLKTIRALHEYHHGYQLTLHSPVPTSFGSPNDWWNEFDDAFPRIVNVQLVKQLKQISSAIEQAITTSSLEPFQSVITDEFSSELCSAIANLSQKGKGIEIEVDWSIIRPCRIPSLSVQFSERSSQALREAVAYFQHTRPIVYDEEFIAHVVSLQNTKGQSTILYIHEGKPIKIEAEFKDSAYPDVLMAYETRHPLRIYGSVYKTKDGYKLRKEFSSYVKVLTSD